jgi:hypothetical protein
MLSLNQLRTKYQTITEPDHIIMADHERRLGQMLQYAVRENFTECEYIVRTISPYAVDMHENTALALLKRARSLGYKARIEFNGVYYVLFLSGWKTPSAEPSSPISTDKVVDLARQGALRARMWEQLRQFGGSGAKKKKSGNKT